MVRVECVGKHSKRFGSVVIERCDTSLDVFRGDSAVAFVDELNAAVSLVTSRAGYFCRSWTPEYE